MHLGAWCNGIALAVVAGLPSGFHDWAQAIDTALRTSLAITACRSLLSPVGFDEVQSHYTLIIDGGGSHRSLVENGQIQIRVEDPLPQDENVLDSKPIHGFTAQTMVPMFKEKFQTIFAKD
ncbi:hypothetical protein AA0119_g9547 [Alternaria tenuissima]|uniref:Uncharacterized protein n=1 Tax=Alternaria tenuissima TaxID=119927 RepID=A0A4Q4S8J9_9PLEO|nr:hypothetical protein AA0115_g1996 [Alternaria tenuissima]RYN35957.1 hypothetical protein AA0114_g11677 [Alternaria tenuissima]RYN50451.1 hypothetical protein AA0118_g11003 [Alternaria tenuissima]RYN93417.1 hypothetical protein AA0119_g9547 [Alternaria tenuissima]RYO22623.1 hypothetical protein AA0121_g2706 [Alternaria tenuissima]